MVKVEKLMLGLDRYRCAGVLVSRSSRLHDLDRQAVHDGNGRHFRNVLSDRGISIATSANDSKNFAITVETQRLRWPTVNLLKTMASTLR
jgi:hypothetical protein